MCAEVHTFFLHKKQEASVVICHRFKLLGDGRVPYVAFKQNDKREDGIFNRDFQEKSFLMKSHHLIQYPCKWSCTAFALNKSSSSSFKTEDINFL